MSDTPNTLFLRLAGPMQSWGTESRFQLRRTDPYPSKSGLLGMLLCAMGVRREDSSKTLEALNSLRVGVRVDRPGNLDWDYHTAGAKIGIWQADRKKGLKRTASTKEYETLLSRRQYLIDASFLAALQANPDDIQRIARVLDGTDGPVWPVFLGRKCCVPAEPVFTGIGRFDSLNAALSSVPWQARIEGIDRTDRGKTRTLDTIVEHPPGSAPPYGATLVYDVPRIFGFYSHGARWVTRGSVSVPVEEATHNAIRRESDYHDPYGPGWDEIRIKRLEQDNHLCVFCKSAAREVHHLDYGDVRLDTLRSLCKICHDACTMLEYGHGLYQHRIDPSDPEQRATILRQIERNVTERRLERRRELLEAGRGAGANFFDDIPKGWSREGS